MPVMWNKIFRRSFLIENELFCPEGFFYEDLYWAFKVMLTAHTIYTLPDTLYRYRIRGNSTSHSMTQRHVDSFITLIKELKYLIDKNELHRHEHFGLILSTYESVRCLAIDNVFQYKSTRLFSQLFDGIKSANICSLTYLLKNKNISKKDKRKLLALNLGWIGRSLFMSRMAISKFMKS